MPSCLHFSQGHPPDEHQYRQCFGKLVLACSLQLHNWSVGEIGGRIFQVIFMGYLIQKYSVDWSCWFNCSIVAFSVDARIACMWNCTSPLGSGFSWTCLSMEARCGKLPRHRSVVLVLVMSSLLWYWGSGSEMKCMEEHLAVDTRTLFHCKLVAENRYFGTNCQLVSIVFGAICPWMFLSQYHRHETGKGDLLACLRFQPASC